MRLRKKNQLFQLFLVFTAYFVTAKIGLSLHAVNDFATLVWPPTGIALVSVLLLGYRAWPAIALAAFMINLATGAPVLVAIGIAVGNTLEALLAVWMLKRFTSFKATLVRVVDVFWLVVFGGLISTLVSATIGTFSLLAGGLINSGQYGTTWLAWWVGDLLGDLVVAPLLLLWFANRSLKINPRRLAETTIAFAFLILATLLVFRGLPELGIANLKFTYVIFPPLIWIAVRSGQRSTAAAIFIVSLVSVIATVHERGPFASNLPSHDLLVLQSFIGITAVTFTTVSAVVLEQETAQKQHQSLSKQAALLEKHRKHLLKLNQAKDEFLAIASHQLRTPATAVRQYIGMLLEGYAEPLSKDQTSFLKKAYDSNNLQLSIIDDLLQVARIDSDNFQINRRRTNISRVVEKSINELRPKAHKNKQIINYTKPGRIMVIGDSTRLQMALENITDNALKYSPAKSTVKITLKKEKGQAVIKIHDEGVGIDPDDYHKLFEKFSRVPNPMSVEVGGSGLGLYWARKVIELHKGSIKVRSALKKGSTFTVTLPIEDQLNFFTY